MQLTEMDYVRAAIAQAYYAGITREELLQIACDSMTPESFDARISAFSDFTEEPEDGQTIIAMPV